MKNRRHAITLVETVAISVAGSILLCMLLPALQRGDEEANRLACLDNLRVIGVAAHEYNELNGQLPPCMGIPGTSLTVDDGFDLMFDYQSTYSLVQLLDLLGHPKLAAETDAFAFSNENSTIYAAGYPRFNPDWLLGIDDDLPGIGFIVDGINIPQLRCPSDQDAPRDKAASHLHPTDNATIIWTYWSFGTSGLTDFSITNYVANMGGIGVTITPTQNLIDAGWIGFHGPIRSRVADSPDTIVDGASNVVMFGEALGEIDLASARDFRHSMVMGGLSVGRADLYPGIDQVFGTPVESSVIQFGSMHPEAVNIVLCDGATRSMFRTLDSTTFGRMCGVEDGLPFLVSTEFDDPVP